MVGSHRLEEGTYYDYVANRQDFKALTSEIKNEKATECLKKYSLSKNDIDINERLTKFNSTNKTVLYCVEIEARIPTMCDDVLIVNFTTIKLSPKLFDELKKENSPCIIL